MRFPLQWLPIRGLISIVSRLPQYLRLAARLMFDRRAPVLSRLVLAGVVLYVVSPFDLIPEAFFPPLGYGEDLIFFFLAVHNLIRSSPPDVVKEHARAIAGKDGEDGPQDAEFTERT